MRTVTTDGSRAELEAMLAARPPADYVYMYPPRQAYRPVAERQMAAAIERSLRREGPLDLYLHFPFCRQICSFCNLYAVVATETSGFETYVEAILREAETYAPLVAGKEIATVYLGGGTPSQLPAELIGCLLGELERLYGFERGRVAEVALEVAPDTVSPKGLAALRGAGINRVNLGLQTGDEAEMCTIGRDHDAALSLRAVEAALAAGFDNVCVDLIYGLEGQTERSWAESLARVAELAPPTVCAYPLTLRPHTGYASRDYLEVDPASQADRYERADAVLRGAGYRQETHVRWALGAEGGYRQKENHWALSNVLGLGAGARGYLWECDYRNGYSARRRMPVLRQWLEDVGRKGHGRMDGFAMDEEERMRKALILGIHDLDRGRFRSLFGEDPMGSFEPQLRTLAELGLLAIEPDRLVLSAAGMRSRDLIVQAFFSPKVRRLLGEYDYADG
jgi:oxygen-independent coproporphyrinogen III oxidase